MEIKQLSAIEVLPVRHQVLWPDKPMSFCMVPNDEHATHYGAFIGGQLVCVASIYIQGNEARLRKFATLPEFQGQGIGSNVIDHAISNLKDSNIQYFWCDARTTALGFYQKFGMAVEGPEFEKSGVVYYKMSVHWE
ncbi:GNAT family N-acetyltransferase [Vibrio splendidus]|uniref:GNAT family N-acetyltransferase n=1 Tax=Vibrio splendidus TaxID=29497 RepID=UPI000D3AA57A|nr:GNAT family N-acetyltransferase [Vibrio splendidus]PTO57655.1 GNAT family N-acetyltransferase [Vibrio splendidus]PTP00929.1 GNAT family N-acetyltransferase [Vibrio splendidus]